MYLRRKVYSVAEDDYGFENLYSVNDTYLDEEMYSVPMTEDELRLFSDFCEYVYSDSSEAAGAAGGVLAGGAAAAGLGAAYYKRGDIMKWANKKLGGAKKDYELGRAGREAAYKDSVARMKAGAKIDGAISEETKRAAKQWGRSEQARWNQKVAEFEDLMEARKLEGAKKAKMEQLIKNAKARANKAYTVDDFLKSQEQGMKKDFMMNERKLKDSLGKDSAAGRAARLIEWGKKNKKTALALAGAGTLGAAGLGYAATRGISSKD